MVVEDMLGERGRVLKCIVRDCFCDLRVGVQLRIVFFHLEGLKNDVLERGVIKLGMRGRITKVQSVVAK